MSDLSNSMKDANGEVKNMIAHANATADILNEGYDKYHELKAAVRKVEVARSKLVGGPVSSERAGALARRFGPSIMKLGLAAGGGTGITALLANDGAFGGVVSAISTLFGGGAVQ